MHFIGIDLGTSSVKTILMDEEGKIIASKSKEYPIYYPQSGWAEQNPEEWWVATKDALKELVVESKVDSNDIKSIGLSGQMHGLVLLDKENKVLHPAILWCDQRTEAECEEITILLGQEKLSQYTANKALPGFTAPKILWVKKHKPDIYAKVKHILLPKDYIRLKLTGEYATDVSDASGMLLLDVSKRTWSTEMLEALNVDIEHLPKCYESSEITGYLTEQVADYTGLSKKVCVVAGGGDNACGAVGTGIVNEGNILVSVGTSGVVFASQDSFSVDKENRLHSFCHANGLWHVMGVMLNAASCMKWWVDRISDGVNVDQTYSILFKEAEQSKPGSNGLVFLPYMMGERTPYTDPYAKGCFIGLDMTQSRGDMTRAILEGVTFGLKDSLEIIKDLNIPIKKIRLVGGGASTKLWQQILADIFNIEVELINETEGPAYGAAILAAVGAGLFKDVNEACSKLIKVSGSLKPNAYVQEQYSKSYSIYRSLYPTLKNTFKMISDYNK